eukprot:scaffold9333_cov119-Isochrysis_galbana.AAC.6
MGSQERNGERGWDGRGCLSWLAMHRLIRTRRPAREGGRSRVCGRAWRMGQGVQRSRASQGPPV